MRSTTDKRQNSFHEEVKKARTRHLLQLACFGFLAALALGGLFWIVFLSPLCKFHAIQISGNHLMSTKVLQKAFAPLVGQNIFFYSFDTAKILGKYPIIESVAIQPELFGNAHITLQEATLQMALQTATKTFIIGSNASVVDSVSNTSTKYHLPLVVSNENNVSKIDLATLLHFVVQLEADKKSFITSFSYTYPYDLSVQYADGHTVLLSLGKNIEVQLSAMTQVGKYIGYTKCKHVDVRFDNVYCSD